MTTPGKKVVRCNHQWVLKHTPSIFSFIWPLPFDNDYICLNCSEENPHPQTQEKS